MKHQIFTSLITVVLASSAWGQSAGLKSTPSALQVTVQKERLNVRRDGTKNSDLMNNTKNVDQSIGNSALNATESSKYSLETSGGVVNGGGGGGVIRDGVPQTFYSAGFYADPTPMQNESIPGLNSLISFIRNDPGMSMKLKSDLLQLLLVTNGRNYLRVTEDQFTRETLNKLVKEYAKATKAPEGDISIYAITKDSTTYLLPNFFKLQSETQKQAILLHELLWVASKDRTYGQVIRAEMAAQAYLEDPQNARKRHNFMLYFATPGTTDYEQSAIAVDIAEGNLAGLIQNNTSILFKDIVGPGFFDCDGCKDNMVNINLYELRQKYPKSEFLKVFYVDSLHFSENGQSFEHCYGNFGNSFNCIILNQRGANQKKVLVNAWKNIAVAVDFAKCSVVLAPKIMVLNPSSQSTDLARRVFAMPVTCPGLPNGLFLKDY